MKKRFFNALILGAVLLSNGAVTSCKDYDDDINNLQSQIDGLKALEQLKTDVATLSSAVDAAKSDAAKALADAAKAQSTADNAATKEQLADLQKAVDAAKAAAQEAHEGLVAAHANLEELIAKKADKADLDAANAKIAEAEAAIAENNAAIAAAEAAIAAAQGDATKALADAAQALADLKGKADKVAVSGLDNRITQLELALNAMEDAGVTTLTADVIEALVGTTEKASLASRVDALESVINSADGSIDLTDLSNDLKDLQNEAKALNIAFSTMITDIQLFHINGLDLNYDHKMTFLQTTEVATYAWYKDLDEKENTKLNIKNKKMETLKLMPEEVFNFVKDSRYVGEDEIIVRVSPVDADLSQRVDDIMFLDSKGREISDVVKVESVKKFDGLLTTRAAGNETGLWVIKVKPVTTVDEAGKVTLDEDRFNEAAIDKSKGYNTSILYSVAIKDNSYAASAEENAETVRRCVTSEYNLTLFTAKAERCYDFNVLTKKNAEETNNRGISVNYIHNRYEVCEDGSTYTRECKELSWLDRNKPSSEVILEGSDANAVNRNDSDNRQWYSILAVEKDEPITIDFTVANNPAKQIKGFFVTLDEEYALESHPSEINAWRSYNYTGVGYTANDGTKHPATLHEGNKGIISVNLGNTNVLGDVIGFRVYAVNLDGTLTDPDGRAFYVAVGDVIKEGLKLSADVKYVKDGDNQYFISDKVAVSDEIKNALADLTIDNLEAWKDVQEDAAEEKHTFDVQWYDADDNLIGTIDYRGRKTGNIVNALNEDEVAYVKFVFQYPGEFIDDATYTQSVVLQKYLSQGAWSDVAKIEFSATKVMPTGVSYGFMSGQNMYQMMTPLWNEQPTNYMVIDGSKKDGRVDFNNVFVSEENKNNSGFQGLGSRIGRYEFSIADGTYKYNDGWKLADLTLRIDAWWPQPLNYIAQVNNRAYGVASLIDSKTKRDIDAKFEYQGISKTYDVETSKYVGNQNYKADAKFVVAANESDDNAKTEQIVYCSWTKDFACKTGNGDNWVKNKKNVVNWTEDATVTTVLKLSDVEINYAENLVIPSLKQSIKKNLGENIGLAYHNLRVLPNSDSDNPVVNSIPGYGYTKGSRGEYNPYFTVDFNLNEETGADVTFTQRNQVTQRPANGDAETLCFTVEDCFGNKFDIALPISVVVKE